MILSKKVSLGRDSEIEDPLGRRANKCATPFLEL